MATGVWFGIQTRDFLQRSISTKGKVIELTEVRSKDSNTSQYTYAPVFQFTDSTGTSYIVASNSSSNPPEFNVGEVIPVRYDPKSPSDAKIDSFLQLWLFSSVFGAAGVVFSLVGTVLFVADIRSRLKTSTLLTGGSLP